MSNFEEMGFVETSSKSPIYEPCVEKNEQGDKITKKVTDKSYLMGYYLGMKEIKTKDGTSNIHEFQLKEVGNQSDLSEPVEPGERVSMWGRTTLDDKLTSNAPIGALCIVQWLGKKQNQAGTRSFHDFKVMVNPNETLNSVGASDSVKPNTVAPQATATASAPAELDDEDDSLPF